MRWLTISGVSSAIGYVGWKLGNQISPTTGLWGSFLVGLAGIWVGIKLFPKDG